MLYFLKSNSKLLNVYLRSQKYRSSDWITCFILFCFCRHWTNLSLLVLEILIFGLNYLFYFVFFLYILNIPVFADVRNTCPWTELPVLFCLLSADTEHTCLCWCKKIPVFGLNCLIYFVFNLQTVNIPVFADVRNTNSQLWNAAKCSAVSRDTSLSLSILLPIKNRWAVNKEGSSLTGFICLIYTTILCCNQL